MIHTYIMFPMVVRRCVYVASLKPMSIFLWRYRATAYLCYRCFPDDLEFSEDVENAHHATGANTDCYAEPHFDADEKFNGINNRSFSLCLSLSALAALECSDFQLKMTRVEAAYIAPFVITVFTPMPMFTVVAVFAINTWHLLIRIQTLDNKTHP